MGTSIMNAYLSFSGNCPLGQALPRVAEIWPDYELKSVLSLAPPPKKASEKFDQLNAQWKKTKFLLLEYFLKQLTDGEATYDQEKKNPKNKNTLFSRVRPNSDISIQFEMDEENVQKMIEAMKHELRNNEEYLNDVFKSAAIIAVRMVNTFSVEHLKMFKLDIMIPLKKMRCYQDVVFIAEEILKRLPNSGKKNILMKSIHNQASVLMLCIIFFFVTFLLSTFSADFQDNLS